MADIKTKETVRGPIKQLDKAAIATQRMKNAYVQTKEKAENSVYAREENPEDYATEKVKEAGSEVTSKTVDEADSQIKKTTRNAKNKINDIRERRAEKQNADITDNPVNQEMSRPRFISKREKEKTVKKVVDAERKGIKTADKTAKTVNRSVKEGKVAIKTSEVAIKTTEKSAEASAKASQKAAAAAKQAAVATGKAIVAAGKAIVSAVKAIISALSSLYAILGVGGFVVLIVILVVCMLAMAVGSVYGFFFSDQAFGESLTLHSVIMEINSEYSSNMAQIREYDYDRIEITGARATWREVLAVYSVQANLCEEGETQVAVMNEDNRKLLFDVFWMMNYIETESICLVEEVEVEVTDDDGNVSYVTEEQEIILLRVTVHHVDPYEMAEAFDFTEEQYRYLDELLDPRNDDLWNDFLRDISYIGDTSMIDVAMTQLGQQGGEPYWSWFGCTERIPWCACFVSWCAGQCGYIDSGVMPMYSGCYQGMCWFMDRGIWLDGSETPSPGMIIFFDWHDGEDNRGAQDGIPDHTGIVTNVDENYVYTIEGNTSDSVQEHSYAIGRDDIMGYGMPQY